MLINPDKILTGQLDDLLYDVCIVGTGPAGITLARKLAQKGRKVALMEAGGKSHSYKSQRFYKGESQGIEYPIQASRLRYFGGASNHWGGETRPLDSRDFNTLAHHPLNDWPISKSDLDGYAQETARILDLESEEVMNDVFEGKVTDLALMQPYFRFSKPVTRFGKKYEQEIVESEFIDLHLNASLIDIQIDQGSGDVTKFVFRSEPDSPVFEIRAQRFILSCGGLENPRILLSANKQMPKGIGNQHDLVGRYFCEHLCLEVGKAIMRSRPASPGFGICSDELMLAKRCLSFMVEFAFFELDKEGSFLDRLSRAIFGDSEEELEIPVNVVTQQACNADSRVTLSDEKDSFGLRKLTLNWNTSTLDSHTIRTAALETAHNLARHDLGRMKMAPFIMDESAEIPVLWMNHHMCTTRMSSEAQSGVVDQNCRVFGHDNLFIGGSSVFGSAGVSNPTYTIVQLALRLADHMNGLFA